MLVLGWWWWASDEMVKSGLKNGWFKVMTIESGSEKGYGMILGCWWWGGDLQVMVVSQMSCCLSPQALVVSAPENHT